MSRRLLVCALFAIGAGMLPLALAGEDRGDGGAAVTVNVADGGDTTISVTRGEVKVRAAGVETRLVKGQGAHVKRGQPARKLSLLPAPKNLEPAEGQRLPSLDVALVWTPIEGARGYHVAVSTDLHFVHRVHEQPQAEGNIANVRLAAGTYYWRVSAVDRDGLEGQLSTPRRFTIDVTPPALKAGPPTWR
jgi:hypothetical protein